MNEPFLQGQKLYIRFRAGSGETYHIQKELTGVWWRTWVTEDSTGKIFEGVIKQALSQAQPTQ